ncbi:MAG: hypothetical protein R3298_07615 [Gammaproteobacteria bacterium]|nr:hypothetical protein [Gammaproteobacteria bacterium]
MNRRDFLSAASRGATAAAAAATPVVATASLLGSDLYDRLAEQLAGTRDALSGRIETLAGELGDVVGRVDRVELRQQLLLYLLLLSLFLDGGFAWFLAHAPLVPPV